MDNHLCYSFLKPELLAGCLVWQRRIVAGIEHASFFGPKIGCHCLLFYNTHQAKPSLTSPVFTLSPNDPWIHPAFFFYLVLITPFSLWLPPLKRLTFSHFPLPHHQSSASLQQPPALYFLRHSSLCVLCCLLFHQEIIQFLLKA